MRRNPRQIFAATVSVLLLGVLAGCGSGEVAVVVTPPPPTNTVSFQGKVLDGSQAVAGATIQMYAAGSSGYGSASTALLTTAVTTDATGAFTVPAGSYPCSSASTQIYLVATGGRVGATSGTSNAALAMMTAWGNCGDLQSSTSIILNEATTAAAVWALAPFMASMQAVGTSSTNQAGLVDAGINARLLADLVTGASPSTSLPPNLTAESAKLYSLANVLASCVNSTGGAPCTTLFTDATAGAEVQPANTVDVALRIVKNPGRNVSTLYQLGNGTYPGLSAPPSDWTMSIAATGGGMNQPASVGIDSTGRAWVINYTGIVSAFSLQGAPIFASGLTSSGSAQAYGLTIDLSDNIWVTDGGSNKISEFTKDGTLLSGASGFSGGGISYPIAAASDASGNIWIVNNGNGSVTKLSNDGTPVSPSAGYTGGGTLLFPVSVAVDASGTPWIASQNGSATHLSASGSLIQTVSCCSIPTGIAVDGHGDPWVADHYANAIVHISGTSGAVLSSTVRSGGLIDPYSLAIDGAGNVWSANAFMGTLTEVAGSGSVGTALSPSTGYGVNAAMQSPYGIAIDGSGNIWVTSYGDSRLVRFIGLATPIKTPLVGAPQLP